MYMVSSVVLGYHVRPRPYRAFAQQLKRERRGHGDGCHGDAIECEGLQHVPATAPKILAGMC